MDWLAAHVGAALSVTTILAGAAGWVSHHLGFFAEKAIDLELVKGLDAVKNPKLKAILLKVDQAVDSEIPGAGDAKYDMLTALIMTALPAEAAPAKPLLEAVLKALGSGAKAGLADVVAAEDAEPVAKSVPAAGAAEAGSAQP
jgi:hypothetical protein